MLAQRVCGTPEHENGQSKKKFIQKVETPDGQQQQLPPR
jgi:hypothetical protein